MRRFNPVSSLNLWKRRLAYRERRLSMAHRAGDSKRVLHWTGLVREAQATVDRRTKQVARSRPMRLRAFDEMEKLVGIVEEGGNNMGRRVVQIIVGAGGTPGEPWCGDTVAYCYLRAGSKMVTRGWAYVPTLQQLLSYVKHPMRGHVVIYEFNGDSTPDHTGMFDRWDPARGPGYFLADEGNTGSSGAVSDSSDGQDGVKKKSRHISQVASFRRVIR